MAKPKLALIPAAQGSKLFSVLPSSGVGDFDFTRSGSATRINSQGLIETVANGVSRLNYPMIDGKVVGCPHHILEPQRTNLVTYSEDFSNAYWSKSRASVVLNSTISPDGSLNASKLVEDTTSGGHILYKNNITTGAGINTLSVKVKANGRNWVLLYDSEQGEAVYFDIKNGVAGTIVGTPDAYSIKKLPNGWYDISLTTTATLRVDFQIYTAESDGNNAYLGDGVSGIYVWGAQLEQGSYPTSYIPTNGTTVTRSAETATGSGDAATFNDSEGVLMAEISALSDEGGIRAISLNNGSAQNRISIRYNSTSNQIQYQYTVGGSVQANILANVVDVKTPHKIAVKYKLNDFELFIDGISRGTDLVGSIMPSGTLTNLDFNGSGSIDYFYGNTKQIQYYNSALTDSELEELTSWESFLEMAAGQNYTIK